MTQSDATQLLWLMEQMDLAMALADEGTIDDRELRRVIKTCEASIAAIVINQDSRPYYLHCPILEATLLTQDIGNQ